MFINYNTKIIENQLEILSDKDKKGNERPWIEKKERTLLLAESYKRLGFKKAYRVQDCGSYLEFRRYTGNEDFKLNCANFCRDRLCPMCIWRRSLKIFGQVSKVMDVAQEENNSRFLFLTLTCKNVYGDELSESIDQLFYSFKKLMLKTKVKKAVKGWFRGLEVTHNIDRTSIAYDTYHPHFHIILMVNGSYFTDTKQYIKQEEWTTMWKECLKVDYIPVVNVKAFKSDSKTNTSKSIAESAKYTVKDNDYLIKDNEELTDNSVFVLDKALKGRRLIAFGGELRKIHKALKLDDAENGDLINTDNAEDIRQDLDYTIERYKWNIGYKQYIKF